jgi:hypothetical protein
MLTTKKSEDPDRIAPARIEKELIALAWVIACTVVFLMMRH